MFAANSRYQTVPTATYTTPSGKPIVYLLRRFIAPPSSFSTIAVYTVKQGDRIDNISAQVFGDPKLYWRLCDANLATRPADLTDTIGTTLNVTLPQGIPATPTIAS
jgi:hypothetical protein